MSLELAYDVYMAQKQSSTGKSRLWESPEGNRVLVGAAVCAAHPGNFGFRETERHFRAGLDEPPVFGPAGRTGREKREDVSCRRPGRQIWLRDYLHLTEDRQMRHPIRKSANAIAAALTLTLAFGTPLGAKADEAAPKNLVKAMSDYMAAQNAETQDAPHCAGVSSDTSACVTVSRCGVETFVSCTTEIPRSGAKRARRHHLPQQARRHLVERMGYASGQRRQG